MHCINVLPFTLDTLTRKKLTAAFQDNCGTIETLLNFFGRFSFNLIAVSIEITFRKLDFLQTLKEKIKRKFQITCYKNIIFSVHENFSFIRISKQFYALQFEWLNT